MSRPPPLVILLQPEVVDYLLKHELIGGGYLVDDELRVIDVSRRNRAFKVVSEHGASFVVKQGRSREPTATLAREAAVYRFLHAHAPLQGRHRYLPRLYEYDARDDILVIELRSNAKDLGEHHSRIGRFPVTIGEQMGRLLSIIHGVSWGRIASADGDGLRLIQGAPWILSLHRPDLGTFLEVSRANHQLIRMLQEVEDLCGFLDALRDDWRAETLIHGDVKWDNCIASRPSGNGTSAVTLIDWEFAAYGDPCWDVGSVFSDYVSCWLWSIPISRDRAPDQFPELARYPLHAMHPAIRQFWNAYACGMELRVAASEEWLLRAVRYAAVRLIQTAFEELQPSPEVTTNVVCALQLALNMLQRPHDASLQLLGIPSRELRPR